MLIAGAIFGKNFRKTSERYLTDFKAFAEAEDGIHSGETTSSDSEASEDQTGEA